MDSLITAAARALALGDPLAALKCVSLREDPPALALRGIAMAQLGELVRARELLRRAARGFGVHEALAQARCVVAEAEVALAMRELGGSPRALGNAVATLESHADHVNALHAKLIAVRRLLLIGRLQAAADAVAAICLPALPPALQAVAWMAMAEIALRSMRTAEARQLLEHADRAARRAGVPALQAEVDDASTMLDRPAARRVSASGMSPLRLDDVAALMDSGVLVVDGCRRGVRMGDSWRPLARRPVLFALARALAEKWPGDVDRRLLIERAFAIRRPNESHRARLRVEIGRLRALLAPMARIEATANGFVLQPLNERDVVLLAPPVDGDQASLLALLGDGAPWSTSALALALGESQRTVQRALAELAATGKVRSTGRARARRWLAPPLTGFTTVLLLPAALSHE